MRRTALRAMFVGMAVLLWAPPVVATLTLVHGEIRNVEPPVKSLRCFCDGGTRNISVLLESDPIWVRNETTLKFLSGGIAVNLDVFDTSRIIVAGGAVNNLIAHDNSQVTVSAGRVNRPYAGGSSRLAVSGGVIGHLNASGRNQTLVTGGTVEREMTLWDHAVVTIDGSNFAVDGTDVGYTELFSIYGGNGRDDPQRRLTGTLINGQRIDCWFRIGYKAKIVLVPEPATLLLLTLGGLVLRKRRYR